MAIREVAGVAVLLAGMAAAQAQAADCHVGAFGGAVLGEARHKDAATGAPVTGTADVRGPTFGVALGCAWPVGMAGWRVGVEGDLAGGKANGTSTGVETSITRLVTLRGVAGAEAAPKVFVYGTAGGAGTSAHVPGETVSVLGFAAGAGVEYALNPSVRLKLEYLYVGFEEKEYPTRKLDMSTHLLRAGVNLHF